MPGIPSIYYGSEWGVTGEKRQGDPALRPRIEKPEWNELTEWISKLASAKKSSEALCYGDFRSVVLTNKQCIFERKAAGERVLVAINADDSEYVAHFDAGCGTARRRQQASGIQRGFLEDGEVTRRRNSDIMWPA